MIKNWLLLFSILFATIVSAQTKSTYNKDSVLNKDIFLAHVGNGEELLNKFSQRFGLKIHFDSAYFANQSFETGIDFFHISIKESFDKIGKQTKTKYILANNGEFYFIYKFKEFDLKNIKYTPKTEIVKTYIGAPTKKNFTLTGKVVDKNSGESLPYATILVPETKNKVISNVDGLFTLTDLPSDTTKIQINYIGYDNYNLYLTPQTLTNNFVVEMEQTPVFDSEVVVFSKIPNVLKTNEKVGVIKLTPAKLGVLPNLGEKDIMRALQLMPGVSAANENSAGLFVRGGTPDQSLVLYDGFTVYNVDHLFGFFSAFNSNAIKDVQLYKGSFDAKYGGRMSSVAEFTGKEGNSKNVNFGGDISLMSINGYVETPLNDKSTLFVAGRRSYQGPLYDEIFKQFNPARSNGGFGGRRFGSSNLSQIASYFYDVNAKYTYRPNTKDVISFSIFNGTDDLDNSTKINTPSFLANSGVNLNFNNSDITNWGNTGASMKWSRRWNPKFYSNGLLSFSNYFSNRNLSNGGTIIRNDSTITFKTGTFENNTLLDYSAKLDFTWELNNINKIEFGGQANHFDVSYKYAQNDTSTLIDRNTQGNLIAGYLQDKIEIVDKLKATIGGRFNYFSPTNKVYVEPRFNLTYNFTDNLSLKASAGRYYQFIKRVIREDIQQGSRDFWALTDGTKLPVAYNDQISLGSSYETTNYLFDVDLFHKKLYGLSEYSFRVQRPFGPGETSNTKVVPVESYLQGSGSARGIDVLLQKKTGKFNGWIAYTLAEVLNNYPAYKVGDFYASNDVRHELKITSIYKWHYWDFSATWIFATGKPYTSIDGGYQQTLPDGSVRSFYIISDKNANRLADYHRLDLAATYNIQLEQGAASISLSIFNAYNHKNEWYEMFNTQNNYIVETTKYFLGMTPNLTFTYKFQK